MKKSNKEKEHAKHHPVCFPTFENYVYLGVVKRRVKQNAKAAGLIILSKKEYRKMYNSKMAIQRLVSDGIWYDTVKYP